MITYDDKFGGRSLLNGDDPRLAQKNDEIRRLKHILAGMVRLADAAKSGDRVIVSLAREALK